MRFVILNTVNWEACRGLAEGKLTEDEAVRRLTGCSWLLRVGAQVDDAEEALRDAVQEFFDSEEGKAILRGEEIRTLTWETAIPWIPDELLSRHGLEVLRHPDVERIVLDGGEELMPDPTQSAR